MELKKTTGLAGLMSLPALDGNVSLLAASGMLTLPYAPAFALSMIVGPATLLSAMTLPGGAIDRILAALAAGLIATLVIVLAAAGGIKVANQLNFEVMRFAGGLAVMSIGLILMGLKLPSKVPVVLMIGGFILSILWR